MTTNLSARSVDSTQRPTVVSVFSGGGGLDLGVEMAGFSTLAAIEIDRWACWTLRTNQAAMIQLPEGRTFLEDTVIFERDVRQVTGQEVLRAIGCQPGQVSVLCGGPPCVSFSIAGAREGLAGETGMLFEAYARMLRVLRPQAFVFENVRGLLTAAGANGEPGGAWPVIAERLRGAGYRIAWKLLDAASFGVPQHRARVIVVGLRGARGLPFVFPEPTHGEGRGLKPLVDVRTAFAGLPSAAGPAEECVVANHVARAHSDEVRASFAATAPGKRNDRWKRDRLEWGRPSKVVRAQGKLKADGTSRHPSSQAIHPQEHRQVTVRECARLQSFPDWYALPPTHCNGARVVGDAVPPLLATAIGRALKAQLEGLAQSAAAAA